MLESIIFLTGNRLYQETSQEIMQANPQPHNAPFPSNMSMWAVASSSTAAAALHQAGQEQGEVSEVSG